MRKLTYGAAVSLDGYIATADGGVDWLKWSDDVAAVTSAYWNTVDTVLVGRKTYDVGVRMGTSSYPGKMTYVFSRTPRTATPNEAGVEWVSTDPVEFVRSLRQRDGMGICVLGGGELARGLIEAGLVDEVGCNIHPILLGSGVPLFRPLSRRLDLELIDSRTFEHGCVYLLYRIACCGNAGET